MYLLCLDVLPNRNLMSHILTITTLFKVALASGKIVTWSWERNAEEMRTLCCGLGMTAVVLAVTFKCIPLQRFVSGLGSSIIMYLQ